MKYIYRELKGKSKYNNDYTDSTLLFFVVQSPFIQLHVHATYSYGASPRRVAYILGKFVHPSRLIFRAATYVNLTPNTVLRRTRIGRRCKRKLHSYTIDAEDTRGECIACGSPISIQILYIRDFVLLFIKIYNRRGKHSIVVQIFAIKDSGKI